MAEGKAGVMGEGMIERVEAKNWRLKHRLTQKELARRLKVGLVTFAKFERGESEAMNYKAMMRLESLMTQSTPSTSPGEPRVSGHPDHLLAVDKEAMERIRVYQSSSSSNDARCDVNRYEPPLDPGIAGYVEALVAGGIETYESCEGGEGHAYPEPTICFYGEKAAGFRALAIAFERGFPVQDLRKFWSVIDDEPVGPDWQMTFLGPGDPSVSLVNLEQHGHPGRELCDAT